jgi:hypothetical protein
VWHRVGARRPAIVGESRPGRRGAAASPESATASSWSEERSRRAAARGDGDVYRGNNHRTVGLAALAACHRLRVASPEALQCLGWRDWALPGAPPFTPPPTPPLSRLRVVSVPPRSGGCAGDGRRGSRGIPSGSGSIAGCTTASRMALRGGCEWIHTSTPTSSQGRRRGRPRSQDDVMVAPYEFSPWPRAAHGMSRVLVRLCNARG